ncbi:MAG TPA: PVC-type heme-binding CxxCH protein [Planctomycetota bacterium]|nr:PVC-type heme-binding CxxCH protein [Planctomycetota bacterium]
MNHLVTAALVALALLIPAPQEASDGIAPLGDDGKPLNLDFETGTLKDWTATGTAFEGQPVKGDAVAKRRPDMTSGHKGEYWIGTYENGGDAAVGTLTSVPFKVTHPWCVFYVGGGAHENTCVALFTYPEKQMITRVSGDDHETMKPVAVDLSANVGKQIYIRLIDQNTGGWGHINFDHFRFFAEKPKLPNQRPQSAPVTRDAYKYAGLPPEEAAKVMTVPDGFHVTLCAGEPDVVQPIAMALDERGRLWVAINESYPIWRPPQEGGQCRIMIYEDTKGDGKFDKKTLFIDNLNFVSGLEVGYGGVFVGAPPYLLFIPNKEGHDKPDGPPVVLLDGWEHQDTHETLNTFIWGPDGWLYGNHGVFTHSNVGKPGTPDSERKKINAGFWRYHPLKHQFEVFAEGASNQWGIDFDDHGQAFATACVIPHLYHVIQGGRYQRQAGQHFNPFTYDDIKTIADHRHYVGTKGPHAGNGLSDAAGGGHAHCGCMVYLGDNFPPEYRGKIFMNNIHGSRVNMDVPDPQGSGFVGKHGNDFILANDLWSQILNLRYGPDGGAYFIDWYDKQQCHSMNPKDHDRSNGRIFKITYQNPERKPVDLEKLSTRELVDLTLHKNDWYVRHARKVLAERQPGAEAWKPLTEIALTHADETRVLRAMWALHVTGGFTEDLALQLIGHKDPYVRAWTIQLSLEDQAPARIVAKMAEMAVKDPSPVVRLYLASGAQRLSTAQRTPIVEALLQHGEDADDHNLPLMYWYATEPVAGADVASAALLAAKSKIPRVREYISRRMAASVSK